MSLEKPMIVEIAEDFLAAQDIFNKIGFELIGTKDDIQEDIIFLVRRKKN